MTPLPVWLEGIGTTGTLITGMYIIITDRSSRNRNQVAPFRCGANLGIVEPSTFTLEIVNPTSYSVYDLTYYVITAATFRSGDSHPFAARFSLAGFGPRWRFEYDLMQDVVSVDVGRAAYSTYVVTDLAGRTWFKQRRDQLKQRTPLTRLDIRRRLAHVDKLWTEQEAKIDVDWRLGRWINLDTTHGLAHESQEGAERGAVETFPPSPSSAAE